ILGVEAVGRSEEGHGLAIDLPERPLAQLHRLGRRLIVDVPRLENEGTLGVLGAALQPAPPQQNAVLWQTVPADADRGDEQAAARDRVRVARGVVLLSELGVDL